MALPGSAFCVRRILAVWIGFFFLSPEEAVTAIRRGGYWLMAVTVGLFALSLFQYLQVVKQE